MVETESNTEGQSGGGMARLKLYTSEGRTVYVGALANLVEASKWGKALARCKRLGLKSVNVEHKNGGCWKPAKVLHAFVLALLVVPIFGACAHYSAPTITASSFEGDPRAAEKMKAWQEDIAAGRRLCEKLNKPPLMGRPCVPDVAVIPAERLNAISPGANAIHTSNDKNIQVSTTLYDAKTPTWYRQSVITHEWAHQLLNHGFACTQRPGVCEKEADVYSVELLQWAYGMKDTEAASAVYARLVTRLGAPAQGSHASGCEEALAFAQRFMLNLAPLAKKCGTGAQQ